MRNVTIVIVLLGLALTAGLAMSRRLDAAGGVILVLVFGVGALTIAVARKSGSGAVTPAECSVCNGLISPNAPYCKHCGAEIPLP